MNSLFEAITLCMIYSIGSLVSIYFLYKIKVTKMSIIDFVFLTIIYFVTSVSPVFVFYKEIIFMGSAFLIIKVLHKKTVSAALMFSFVVLFKQLFSYPVDSVYNLSKEYLLNHYFVNHPGLFEYVSIVLNALVTSGLYLLGALIIKKAVDVNSVRMKSIYTYSSLITVVLVFVVGYLKYYILSDMMVGLNASEQYFLMTKSLLILVLIPVLVTVLLKRLYEQDLRNQITEEELKKVNDTRMLAYRYNHNINSMILTMKILATKKDSDALSRYLDDFENK